VCPRETGVSKQFFFNERERMFIAWQPPMGKNDDYDIKHFWISGSCLSRRRKEKGRSGKRDERPTLAQRSLVTSDVSEKRTCLKSTVALGKLSKVKKKKVKRRQRVE